ncbi:MAG: glucose-6-phosphate dehydrogenase assembly protein OpcA [Myxococcota bacterium]|nr:glucose-6-phosphate dehydrogenase assembly protein OpcA [Myxococcota bacterium]MDW8362061.1 glucose-6-phosphate dehydrogenase assembly protein OpcA [Myxococcales bacterium]
MRPSTRVERFASGDGVQVELGAIERDLASLWRAASERGHAVTRACLWNLVWLVEDEVDLENARALVDALVGTVPARVLLVSRPLSIGGDAELQAWVSARCQPAAAGGKLLCSEEITIAADATGRARLPPLVRALLVPDVPAALLTRRLPASLDDLIAHLGDVDRVVVDSGRPASPGLDAAMQLGELHRRARARADLVDLGWLRAGPFRALFASFFDPPIGPSPLRRAARVLVEHDEKGAIAGLLLFGWLAIRLHWSSPRRTGRSAWALRRPDGEHVELVLEPRPSDAGSDGIHLLALETLEGERFAIRDVDPHTIEWAGTGLEPRRMPSPEWTDEALLVEALGARGLDRTFELALRLALDLLDA